MGIHTTVVSDTSPLRAVHHLRKLDLLDVLFEEVLIPPAVAAELRNSPAGDEVLALGIVQIRAPADRERVEELRKDLHLGESEALALALEVAASSVLIDEADGRAAASAPGLDTLGILTIARSEGLIGPVAPLITKLKDGLNFFISDALRARVLRQVGE